VSSRDEVQIKVEKIRNDIDKRIERMNLILQEKMKIIKQRVARETLQKKFSNDEPVEYFEWTFKRVFTPQTCFGCGKTIYPGMKAYKGVKSLCPEMPADQIEFVIYPQVIWLTKEEFTIRRLRGQI